MSTNAGLEIERKFHLRTAPSPEVLAVHGAVSVRLEQVYLGGDGDPVRLRRIEQVSGVEYRRTRKHRVGPFTFEEHEEPVDAAAWEAGLALADPHRRPIRKVRHVVPHGSQRLEIDVFEEPPGLVVLEVELRDEGEQVALPAWIGEWREVTGDARYFNASLARLEAMVPAWPGDESQG